MYLSSNVYISNEVSVADGFVCRSCDDNFEKCELVHASQWALCWGMTALQLTSVECFAVEQSVQGRRGRIMLLRPATIRFASNKKSSQRSWLASHLPTPTHKEKTSASFTCSLEVGQSKELSIYFRKRMKGKPKSTQAAMEGLAQGVQMSLTYLDTCTGDPSHLYKMIFWSVFWTVSSVLCRQRLFMGRA